MTNSCYFILNDTRLNWFGGLAYCSLYDGHLLVIEDEAELNFINSHFIEVYGSAWTGLNNLNTEGKVTQHSNLTINLQQVLWRLDADNEGWI